MGVKRIVPNLGSRDLGRTREFYATVLGLDVGMDLGWIVTLVSPASEAAQVSLHPASGDEMSPALTIEVTDVDLVHSHAQAAGCEIVYPLADEEWGVRRFFVRDPDGRVINVMSHKAG